MNDVVLEVKQEDIDVAIPGNPTRCPVAVACKRQFGITAIVSPYFASFMDFYLNFPDELTRNIREFDFGGVMLPNKYTVSRKGRN